MNINTKKKKDSKKSGKSTKKSRRKRAPLSVAATRQLKVNNKVTVIDFD